MQSRPDPVDQRINRQTKQQTEPRTINLIGEPRDVHVARGFARQVLTENGVDDADDDAILVVSELVTNAIVHGRAPITLMVEVQADSVLICVSDAGHGVPTRKFAQDHDEGGRGLGIVDGLSKEWYIRHDEGSKAMIARLPLRFD